MRINSVHLQPLKENLDSQETYQNLNVKGVKSDPIWLDFYGNQFDPNNPTAHRNSAQSARVNLIQVRPAEKVSEETKIKIVMKCGVNLKPNKSSRDNARTNSCETNSQERGEQCFEENTIEACNSGNTRKRAVMGTNYLTASYNYFLTTFKISSYNY